MATVPIEQYDQKGVEAFANHKPPIPGQSLTASPDNQRPFERPPEYTDFREAINYIAAELLREDVYMAVVKAVAQGMPITDLAMNILYTGFREGKWNPDLLIILVEPLIFIIMALAEKAGIEYRLTGDEEDDLDEDEEIALSEERTKYLSTLVNKKVNKVSSIPKGAVPSNIMQQIQSLEVPESLLQRTESPEEESLLGRTE